MKKPKSVTHVPEHLLPMSPVCTKGDSGGLQSWLGWGLRPGLQDYNVVSLSET